MASHSVIVCRTLRISDATRPRSAAVVGPCFCSVLLAVCGISLSDFIAIERHLVYQFLVVDPRSIGFIESADLILGHARGQCWQYVAIVLHVFGGRTLRLSRVSEANVGSNRLADHAPISEVAAEVETSRAVQALTVPLKRSVERLIAAKIG